MNKKIILIILASLLLLTASTGCCRRDREDPIYIFCRIWYPPHMYSQVETLPAVTLPEQVEPVEDTVGDYSLP